MIVVDRSAVQRSAVQRSAVQRFDRGAISDHAAIPCLWIWQDWIDRIRLTCFVERHGFA